MSAIKALLRIDARKRSKDWFETLGPVWKQLGQDSDLANMGLWPADGARQAQLALIDALVAPLPKTGRWLDVGCGRGGALNHLLDAHPEIEGVGVDLDEGALRDARVGSRGTFLWADGDRLPFRESFDVVIAVEMAHRTRDRDQLAHQLWTALKPGGWLVVADWVERPENRRAYDGAFLRALNAGLARSNFATTEGWLRRLRDLGMDPTIEDWTAPVLAGSAFWLERLRSDGALPKPIALGAAKALGTLAARGPDGLLGYAAVRAQKPEDSRWANS